MLIKDGLVTKKIGKHLYVTKENKTYSCSLKGNLIFNKTNVVLGDHVDIQTTEDEGIITNIHQRSNEIYRPRISNIDNVFLITALKEPDLNTYRLNKYISFCEIKNLNPIIIFSKKDIADSKAINIAKLYKNIGYEYFIISGTDDSKIDSKFYELLKNKISVFTGQSGAGKSTLLNKLDENLNIRTREISKALDNGKHTTTSSELYEYKGGYIADTPGFSSFDMVDISPVDVARSFRTFKDLRCKFNDCLHINNTPGCGVIEWFKKNNELDFFKNDYEKIIREVSGK